MEPRERVPDACLGVWRRTLLTTAGNALVDTSTEVRWLQTPSAFGDVRIPQPDAGPQPLAGRDAAGLAALAPQWAFAGHTVVTDDNCQWHREARRRTPFAKGQEGSTNAPHSAQLDYQPPGGPPDVGRMRWVHSEKVYEDDVDGVEYHEVWERLPESKGDAWALRLSSSSAAAEEPQHRPRAGFLLVAGDCFMFVADRVGAPLAAVAADGAFSETCRLGAALDALPTLQAKREALSFEASYGRVAPGGDGAPAWRIELSTLPGRAGAALLPPGAPTTGGVDALLAWVAAEPGGKLHSGEFAPPGGWVVERDIVM